MLDNITENKL